jgi:hypothetical protein
LKKDLGDKAQMDVLPCQHDPKAVVQIEPTADLLKTLDTKYPKVLISEGIRPQDYHSKKVFRSAVERIRGEFIASYLTARHALVQWVLQGIKDRGAIADFEHTGGTKRYDFEVLFSLEPRTAGALEVKGGEGNSINISERPIWAQEFAVWCHLDGAITNQPSHGAYAIIFNRLTSELVKRKKRVDVLLIRDALCGTALRPCPKHASKTDPTHIAPDIFLFPQRVPTLKDPRPPVHTLETLRLPSMVLEFFGVSSRDYEKHLWEVQVEVFKKSTQRGIRTMRRTTIYHQGSKLGERESYV